jgi:hypothetical protein
MFMAINSLTFGTLTIHNSSGTRPGHAKVLFGLMIWYKTWNLLLKVTMEPFG